MKRFQYFKSNAKATIASALVVFLSVSAVYVYGQCTETIQYGSNCFNPPLSTSCPSSPPSCGTCWECTGGPTSESQCAGGYDISDCVDVVDTPTCQEYYYPNATSEDCGTKQPIVGEGHWYKSLGCRHWTSFQFCL
jgi:hypothetical protein